MVHRRSLFFSGGLALLFLFPIGSNGAVQRIATDLERSLQGTYTQALAFSSIGEAWVIGQRGLIVYNDTNLTTASQRPPSATAVPAGILKVIPIEPKKALAITLDGAAYWISPGKKAQLALPSVGRLISRPLVLSGGIVYRSTELGIYVASLSDFSQPPEEARTPEFISGRFTSNIAYDDEAGICAAIETSIYCRLGHAVLPKIEVFTSIDESRIVGLAKVGEESKFAYWSESGALGIADLQARSSGAWTLKLPFNASGVKAAAEYGGFLLLGGDAGLYAINLASGKISAVDLGGNVRVTNLASGPHGIWVAHESGVSLVVQTMIQPWPENYLSAPIEVLALETTGAGILVGTYDGIFLSDASNMTTPLWPSENVGVNDHRITTLQRLGERLWAGSFSGNLYEFSMDETNSLREENSMKLNSGVSALLATENGLIVGTANDGLMLLQDDQPKQIELPLSWKASPSPITSLTPNSTYSHVVVTSENDVLLLCADRKWEICGHSDSSKLGSARPVFLASAISTESEVLIGSMNGGLFQTSLTDIGLGKPLSTLNIAELNNKPIFTLSYNPRDSFWAGTDQEIVRFHLHTPEIDAVTGLHGLINRDANHGAALLSDSGHLYVGGKHGFSAISTSFEKTRSRAPRIQLADVAIGGGASVRHALHTSDRPLPDGVELPRSNQGVSFGVAINDFRDISKNLFEFRLDGMDGEPVRTIGDGRASYNFLPPGNYTFRARGADPFGVWSENEIVIPITVLPAPWKTWWAYALYVSAAVALLTFFLRYQAQRVRIRTRMEQAAEDQAALARLEDERQESQELTDRLLGAVGPSAMKLLETVEAAVDAERVAAADNEAARLAALQSSLHALRLQERISVHTTLGDSTNVHTLVTELVATIAEASPIANARIFVNDTPDVDIPAPEARYLALIVHELLDLAMNRPSDDSAGDSIVQMEIVAPAQAASTANAYKIVIEDRDQNPLSDRELDRALPVTIHLIELFAGTLETDDDFGLHLELELTLSAA